MTDYIAHKLPEDISEKLPEDKSDKLSNDISGRLSDNLSDDSSVGRSDPTVVRQKAQFDTLPDDKLIELLRAGSSDVEDYLMNKYKNLVRSKARRLYLAGGDRDDLLQEGMWGLFKAIREYRPERAASFYTFAELCITRQMYSAVSAAKAKKNSVLNDSLSLSDINEMNGGYDDGPEMLILEQEREKELLKQIRLVLSPLENKVLDNYLEGLDYLQIADILGKSPKSIDNALQRIKKKIRGM